MKDKFEELYTFVRNNRKYSTWSQQRTIKERAQEVQNEVNEMLEELEKGDMKEFVEELGDVLWDTLVLIETCEDKGVLKFKELLESVRAKFARRKPYIVQERLVTVDEEARIWKEVKQQEKKEKQQEMWDLIDENDAVIGTVSKKEAVVKNLLHRGIAVFVFNSKGEIFVHKRVATERLYPSMYDMSVGGCVDSGEDYDSAAKREVKEELGVDVNELKYLFTFRYKSNEDNFIAKIYSCVHDGPFVLQEDEIESGEFMTIEGLEEEMKSKSFCPDMIQIYNKYKEHETA